MADRLDFVIYGATGYTGYYCVKVTIGSLPLCYVVFDSYL